MRERYSVMELGIGLNAYGQPYAPRQFATLDQAMEYIRGRGQFIGFHVTDTVNGAQWSVECRRQLEDDDT